MKLILAATISFLMVTHAQAAPAKDFSKDFYALELKDIDGKPVKMSAYQGKVLMIVNTASQCGFTPQFKNLTELQAKYGPRGFQVLAFPSNDFKQDSGTGEEVKKFADEKFHVNFPLMDKAAVAGDKKQEIYKILVGQRSDFFNEVQWNFEKFLVSRKGVVVERYRSMTKPDDAAVLSLIEKLLAEQ